MSLFNFAMEEDIANLSEHAKTRANPYGISYESICRDVMGPKQRTQLRRMIDFRFERHPSINLPEERLQAIEKLLEQRTRELLSLPRYRTKRAGEITPGIRKTKVTAFVFFILGGKQQNRH